VVRVVVTLQAPPGLLLALALVGVLGLAEAKAYLDRAPMLLGYPGLAITTFGLACNLVGDGVRDALDPRFERRGAS
jgi:hypothetical protein